MPHPLGQAAQRLPLLDRPPGATLFGGPAGSLTAAAFLAEATRCAALLPAGRHMVNACTGRDRAAIGLAAALLRGQVSLLTGDQSAHALLALAARHEATWVLTDDPAARFPLPSLCIAAGPPPAAAPDPGSLRVPLIASGQPAVIVFSSGSTGTPVGTAKTFGELAWRSRAAAERFGLDEAAPATIVATVPPHHMYGCETTILLPLHAPAASWCGPVFYPGDLQEALQACQGRRILVTTPLHLRAMLAMKGPARPPDAVISATAPLAPALAAQAEAQWGCPVLEIFGASEVGSIASRRTVTEPAWHLYPGVTLHQAERPMVHAEAAAPRPLADVIDLDPTGTRFHLLGRCNDLVKLAGRRASLAGLSRTLTELDGVADGAFLAPDDLDTRPNARLAAFVVSPRLSTDDVLGVLRQRIDPVFLPRPLLRVPALPRNALGKLPRQALLDLLAVHGR